MNLLQKPLFLILTISNVEEWESNDYRLYSSIIENLILEYNKNRNIKNYKLDLNRYNIKNENKKLEKFIIHKLSLIAYDLDESLNMLTRDEVNYILNLGFLTTKNYGAVNENLKYKFINKIVEKYFVSQYIANINDIINFKKHIKYIENRDEESEKYDVFAFLNFILQDKKKKNERLYLIETFKRMIDKIDNLEKKIKLMRRLNMVLEDKEINRYKSRIKKEIYDKIEQVILIKEIEKFTKRRIKM